MRMKQTMDILLASRTLEQVDEFRRRSGPDCFFFPAQKKVADRWNKEKMTTISIKLGEKKSDSRMWMRWRRKRKIGERERESFDFIFQCFDWPLGWAVRHLFSCFQSCG